MKISSCRSQKSFLWKLPTTYLHTEQYCWICSPSFCHGKGRDSQCHWWWCRSCWAWGWWTIRELLRNFKRWRVTTTSASPQWHQSGINEGRWLQRHPAKGNIEEKQNTCTHTHKHDASMDFTSNLRRTQFEGMKELTLSFTVIIFVASTVTSK